MFEDAGKRAANEMTVWGENRFHFMQVPRKKNCGGSCSFAQTITRPDSSFPVSNVDTPNWFYIFLHTFSVLLTPPCRNPITRFHTE